MCKGRLIAKKQQTYFDLFFSVCKVRKLAYLCGDSKRRSKRVLGILKNNIPRDIWKNRITYLLMALFIAIGMYIASTLASVTYSTKVVCEENYITL